MQYQLLVVYIITVMRHPSPLLAVSECGYLGEFKAVGDSCNVGDEDEESKRQYQEEII